MGEEEAARHGEEEVLLQVVPLPGGWRGEIDTELMELSGAKPLKSWCSSAAPERLAGREQREGNATSSSSPEETVFFFFPFPPFSALKFSQNFQHCML